MRTPKFFSKTLVLLAFSSLLVPLVDGCRSPGSPYGKYEWAIQVGRNIDPVAKGVEEYGTISMSSPLFTFPTANDGTFTFDLNRSAEKYFEEAKSEIQGAAAISSVRSVDTKVGVKLQADINQILSNMALMEAYRDNLSRFKQKRDLSDAGTMLKSFEPLLGVIGGSESILKDLGGPDALMKLLGIPTEEELAAAAAEKAAAEAAAQAAADAAMSGDGGNGDGNGDDDGSDDTQPDDDDKTDEEEEPKSPLTRLVEALGKGATGAGEGLAGEATRPPFPELGDKVPEIDDDVLPSEDERIAKDVLARGKFFDFMELLKDETKPTVSNRSAIISAAGDKTTEAILRFISNPAKAAGFKDRDVLFGVATVAVNPGHRTYRGYSADISVQTGIEYVPVRPELKERLKKYGDNQTKKFIAAVESAQADFDAQVKSGVVGPDLLDWLGMKLQEQGIPETTRVYGGSIERTKKWLAFSADQKQANSTDVLENREKFKTWIFDYGIGGALVAAVSPMTETQTLDLKSSVRRQKSSALKLAAALSGYGAKLQAQAFKDYVQRLEQDVSTRSAINVTTSYSQSGSRFGFQITPRLKALSDASSRKARPAMTMDPLAFPVLVLVGLKDSSTQLFVREIGGRLVLIEPMITLNQTTRWIPQGDPIHDDIPFGRWWDRCWKPRLTETKRWDWAARLNAASDEIKEHTAGRGGATDIQNFANNRVAMLRYQALNSQSQHHLPLSIFVHLPAVPKVTDVIYTPIVADGTKEYPIYLIGANLSRLLTDPSEHKMLIGKGAVTKAEHVGDEEGRRMKLTFKPDKVSSVGNVVFNLPYKDHDGATRYTYSPAVKVSPPPSAPTKTPKVLDLISNKLSDGRLRIVLIGDHLDKIILREIDVVTKSGKVVNPHEKNGVIYFHFDLTPGEYTFQHVFSLPYLDEKKKKKNIHTKLFINTPSAASLSSEGSVTIKRDGEGKIIGVETGDGGFKNGTKLLALIKDALNNDQDFSLELSAEGGAKINAGARTKP